MSSTIDSSTIPGFGIDADASARPGIPMELEPPRPAGAAHWAIPSPQPDPGGILRRKGLDELTPVFGVTIAPRGLSGIMRRGAYAIAEHRALHWLVLLAADRVDAVESRILPRGSLIAVGATIAGVAGVVLAATRASRRRSWWRARLA